MAWLAEIGFVLDALYLHVIRKRLAYGYGILCLFLAILAIFFIPASGFPQGVVFTVPPDASFRETSRRLEEYDIVGWEFMFRALARVTLSDDDVRSGRYLFSKPEGMAVVLWRLVNGDSGIPSVRVTFPEGITVREMGAVLKEKFPALDTDAFIAAALPYEGYLFPDTYDFYADVTPEEIVARMRDRFAEAALPLYERSASDESLERIIIMASILEKETKLGSDRAVVSGILWNRIEDGMGLQVDAVFGYIKGIPTYHPSGDDLEIDSPYNTYKYRDLPPGPIGNPGADAIEAALAPAPTSYVYYLFGNDGQMHYAETFEGHKENKERYLR